MKHVQLINFQLLLKPI